MAVVGKRNDSMPLIMDLDTPSNADAVSQMLRESEAINLYPEVEEDPSEAFSRELNETYGAMYAAKDAEAAVAQNRRAFLETTKADLLSLALYQSLVSPVQEAQLATSRERDVALNSISDFVHEEGVDLLLDQFRFKNQYLAEIAFCVEEEYDRIVEGMECKVKEGLPEEDVCEIEDRDVKKYLVDCSDKVPRDITNTIAKRVEGAITDFVDDKKKSQFKIKQIYDKAREKVDQYNQAQQAMDMANQTDAATSDGVDPEVKVDANLNAKLDAQNQEDLMNQASPGYDPVQMGAMPGVGMTPQQEAMAWAKAQESEILESSYNVFDAMMRVLVESTHKTKAVRDQYLKEDGSKVDFERVFNDVRSMYTVLEALSTVEAIHADADYLGSMIRSMQANADACADKTA